MKAAQTRAARAPKPKPYGPKGTGCFDSRHSSLNSLDEDEDAFSYPVDQQPGQGAPSKPKHDHRKNKRNRSTLSCFHCHQNKRKCDRAVPCARCHTLGQKCVYEHCNSRPQSDPVKELDRLKLRVNELESVLRLYRGKNDVVLDGRDTYDWLLTMPEVVWHVMQGIVDKARQTKTLLKDIGPLDAGASEPLRRMQDFLGVLDSQVSQVMNEALKSRRDNSPVKPEDSLPTPSTEGEDETVVQSPQQEASPTPSAVQHAHEAQAEPELTHPQQQEDFSPEHVMYVAAPASPVSPVQGQSPVDILPQQAANIYQQYTGYSVPFPLPTQLPLGFPQQQEMYQMPMQVFQQHQAVQHQYPHAAMVPLNPQAAYQHDTHQMFQFVHASESSPSPTDTNAQAPHGQVQGQDVVDPQLLGLYLYPQQEFEFFPTVADA